MSEPTAEETPVQQAFTPDPSHYVGTLDTTGLNSGGHEQLHNTTHGIWERTTAEHGGPVETQTSEAPPEADVVATTPEPTEPVPGEPSTEPEREVVVEEPAPAEAGAEAGAEPQAEVAQESPQGDAQAVETPEAEEPAKPKTHKRKGSTTHTTHHSEGAE